MRPRLPIVVLGDPEPAQAFIPHRLENAGLKIGRAIDTYAMNLLVAMEFLETAHQPGLTDSRVADQVNETAAALSGAFHCAVQFLLFLPAADEGHRVSFEDITGALLQGPLMEDLPCPDGILEALETKLAKVSELERQPYQAAGLE